MSYYYTKHLRKNRIPSGYPFSMGCRRIRVILLLISNLDANPAILQEVKSSNCSSWALSIESPREWSEVKTPVVQYKAAFRTQYSKYRILAVWYFHPIKIIHNSSAVYAESSWLFYKRNYLYYIDSILIIYSKDLWSPFVESANISLVNNVTKTFFFLKNFCWIEQTLNFETRTSK